MSPEEYKYFEKHDLIARDFLAADRTLLAIERTFLAFVRTALTFLIASISLIKLFPGTLMETLGWILLPLGVFTVMSGINIRVKYRRVIKRLVDARKTDPGTSDELPSEMERSNDD